MVVNVGKRKMKCTPSTMMDSESGRRVPYKAIVYVQIEQSGQTKVQDECKVALCFGTQSKMFNHPDYLK